MHQVLHILRKDIRHLWLEVVLELILLAVYVWIAAQAFAESGYQHPMMEFFATGFLLLGWWYLIARVVFEEPLVGDRQFWITRPYDWKSLLAAKLAFILLWINLPLLFAQATLLRLAGYAPGAHVGGLLWLQLTVSLILLLPAAALMTVLRREAQYVLIAIAVPAFYLLLRLDWFLSSPTAGGSGAASLAWIEGTVTGAVLAVAVLIAIFLQYRSRRTAISRSVLGGGLALILFGISPAIPWNSIIAFRYRDQSTWPVIAFDSSPERRTRGNSWPGNFVVVSLPVQVSEIPENSSFIADAMRASIQAPGGEAWHTGWFNRGSYPSNWIRPDFTLEVDRGFFDKVKTQPVRVYLEFAIRLLHSKQVVHARLTGSDVRIPNVATCYLPDPGNYRCRAPLRQPRLLAITAQELGPDCVTATGTPPPNWRDYIARSVSYELGQNMLANSQVDMSSESPYPAETGINPVKNFRGQMQVGSSSNTFPDWVLHLEYFCPGSTLAFTTQETTAHVIRTMDINGIRLADYGPKQQ